MTATALDQPAGPSPANLSQSTAVEQARAVAEVHAAVAVAKANPRDTDTARQQALDSCSRMATAERAFYRVPNRGEGPSVHLARELARCWGNIDYGVKELRRDDRAGRSEIMAWAWDVETNARSVRTFIVPHERMARGKRTPLVDLADVYLNNQNVGARAVRECVFTVLPSWLVSEAAKRCRQTLVEGEGKPLRDRVAEAVQVFARLNVTEAMLTERVGKPAGQWDEQDIAGLAVLYQSVTSGDVTVAEEFGERPATTGADLIGEGV